MKTKDYVISVIIALFFVMFINHKHPEEDSKTLPPKEQACMMVKISHAGTEELRKGSTDNLKMNYAVCMNERGEAVIDTSYDNFVNTIIAEYDEWRE